MANFLSQSWLINRRHALRAMGSQRMTRRNGDIVHEAEAHWLARAGVVSGRARRDKGVIAIAAHHLTDGGDGGACGAPDRLDRAIVHRRIIVESCIAFARRRFVERVEIILRMNAQQRLDRRRRRVVNTHKRREMRRCESFLDCAQSFRPLGMTGTHFVFEAAGMRINGCFHGLAALSLHAFLTQVHKN